MQSTNDVRKLQVQCECLGKVHKVGLAKHSAQADITARTFEFFDNIFKGNVPSTLSAKACSVCNGTGYVLVNSETAFASFLKWLSSIVWGTSPPAPSVPVLPSNPPPAVPSTPTPSPTPPLPKYEWETPAKARHSVRIICDEEGLTVEEKNLLCQVIHCESGFNINATHKNTDARQTTDYGICMFNSYWYRDVISSKDALRNPELAVRTMIKAFKEGRLKDWVCYSTMYKSHPA